MTDPIEPPTDLTPPPVEQTLAQPIVAVPGPPAKLSKLVWVFAALIVLQLIGGAVGAAVYVTDKRVADRATAQQNTRVADLQHQIDQRTADLTSLDNDVTAAQARLAKLEEQGKPIAGCQAAVQALVDAALKNDIDGQQPLISSMVTACGAS